jgi:arabinose-5-phosphate isomerase
MRADNLPVIDPSMKLGEAIIRISNGKLGMAVAVEDGKVVGLVTDGDIRRATESLQERFFNVPVEEVMTRTPVCVPPTMKLGEILNKLNNHKIHAVLVVNEEQQLLGIVDNFRCMM